MSTITLPLDDALEQSYAALAEQAGVDLHALLASLIADASAVRQTLGRLVKGGGANQNSVEASLAEIEREMQEREQAFARGENVPQLAPLSCAQKGFDAGEFRRIWQEVSDSAKASGASEMTLDEINAEIAAARREMREHA
ncbi:MAG: hypothetical protein IJM64_01700 [Ottowia sp.]|nr:hypothetical protein [Ottowia sp.]MBQ9578057.1 hypothetical protein [Ottowia sp.]